MSTSNNKKPVAIVTGASSGIGLGVTQALLERGYHVVANSRTISKSKELKASEDLVLNGENIRIDGEHMLAPSGNKAVAGGPSSRLSELGMGLPAPPTPLGAYVESSDAGNLLFLSGTLPVVNRKLAISGRLGENLSVT